AKVVFYPDDPSNVYHSYLNDHVEFRILHAGAFLTHVHHQHAHQWLHTPNDQNGSYLDSQMISPGVTYTLEIDYNGSGNRNKTVGDSIFHCHFYPHFAQGMWSLWRVHDVFELGTQLFGGPNTVAAPGTRALPDGEVQAGTPIPAIVPLPTLAMAPIPGYVQIQNGQMVYGGTCQNNQINGIPVQGGCSTGQKLNGQVVVVSSAGKFQNQFKTTSGLANPGYPFFISGIAGHRPPHPPFDIACQTPKPGGGCTTYLDGGLPRHVITSPQNPTSVPYEQHNIWDFTKENVNFSRGTPTGALRAVQVPENGTPVEQVAMRFMSVRQHPSFTPARTTAH